ncbi:SRPBCC domain-containing protein [Flavobacteriaceae bacterium AU392]|nr:SRPBCC domain-containing protein [Flavobacteriaceae bacterium]RKM86057.1 SRPBCC domain-containing protein [Flavobacteriaceae bacterium AU392]
MLTLIDKNLKVSKSIEINAKTKEVWDALINPEKIKLYLFETEVVTDWKIGNSIVFKGKDNDEKYIDKGTIIENKKEELLKYSYWSEFYKLEDTAKNYALVTYKIQKLTHNKVLLKWEHEGFVNEINQKHSEGLIQEILEQVKKITEGQ